MPLKAKMLVGQAKVQGLPPWSSQKQLANSIIQQMSTETDSDVPEKLPGDEPDDVLFNSIYGVRTVELNRPKKLNSLNGSMARKIIHRLKVTLTALLKEWERSQLANVIIIKGAGPKAFCAGGDVAELAKQNLEGPEEQLKSQRYFGLEYKLDHLIAIYSKPYVAFMDGITMGGGVGLSVHAPFRIATERTVFAMPETTIGFFPDVGGSFFLPRLDGEIGTYLALTSERLKGVNNLYAGTATHYIHSSSLPDLEARLSELTFKDYAPLEERFQVIDSTIEEFVTGLPENELLSLVGETRDAIDRCFKHDTIEAILAALGKENSPWAEQTIKTLHERSPTSVRVTLRQLRLGRRWSISETFQREYHIAGKFMKHPDFTEGVFARLIRKPPNIPKWQPASLEATDNSITEDFFKVEGEKKLQLLKVTPPFGDYHEYPYRWLSLPSERDIEAVVREGDKTREQIVQHFISTRRGKAGVREKVSEVLERKTRVSEVGKASWVSS